MANLSIYPPCRHTHCPLDCCFTPIFTQLENQRTHFWEWVVTTTVWGGEVCCGWARVPATHTLHDLHCTCRHLSVFTYIMPPYCPTHPPLTAVSCSNQPTHFREWVVRTTVSVGEVCCGWARVPATHSTMHDLHTHMRHASYLPYVFNMFLSQRVCLLIFGMTK